MKTLSRNKIQRMIDGYGQGSGGGGGTGDASSIESWTNINFISKDFFNQAFLMLNNGTWVKPNDTESGVTMLRMLVAASFAEAVTMEKTLIVNGAVTMRSTLDVTGDITMGSKLVATQEWTNNNYVSIAYFARLFQAYNGTTAVNPNDLTTTIDNIKAMFGFWTQFYLSALGNGGSAGSAIYLRDLADVNVAGVQNGQALVWSSASAKWIAGTPTSGTVRSVGLSAPTGFNVTGSPVTGTGTITLSFATGYALPTTADVNKGVTAYGWGNHANAGYATTSQISDMATMTWVGQQNFASQSSVNTLAGYFDSSGNAKSALKLTTVSKTAWGQTYWTANGVPDTISGNMSSVGNISFSSSGKNIGGIAYFDTTNSRLGVNNSSPTAALDVTGSGVFSGTVTVGNLYSNGYVTALSDLREKNIIDNFVMSIEKIAMAPIIRYRWKDGHDHNTHVGSVAQYWQRFLPEAVPQTPEGRLTMDYGVIALLSSITIAQKVMSHEERIKALEEKIKAM